MITDEETADTMESWAGFEIERRGPHPIHASQARALPWRTWSGVRPDDLAATIFHLLGIDPHTEVYDTLIAAGNPVMTLIA